MSNKHQFGLKIHGCRGTTPHCDADQVKCGGNTICVEVLHDGPQFIILDAGTGLAKMGDRILTSGKGKKDIHLFFSHYHWDHIMGLPFFTPIYIPGYNVNLYGQDAKKGSLEEMVSITFSPGYSPIHSPQNLLANIRYAPEQKSCSIDGIQIERFKFETAHPSGITVFKVTDRNHSLVFATDIEVRDTHIRDKLVEICRETDLLVMDSQYPEDIYREKAGWGHSTYQMAADVAERSGAKNVLFFHHDPFRTDEEIFNNCAEITARYPGINFDVALEDMEYWING